MTRRVIKVFPVPGNVEQPEAHVTDGTEPILATRLAQLLTIQLGKLGPEEVETCMVEGIDKARFALRCVKTIPPFEVMREQLDEVRQHLNATLSGPVSFKEASALALYLLERLAAIEGDR